MNITLRSFPSYPDSQAKCPTCNKLVHCYQLSYARIGDHVHEMKLWHQDCDTKWKLDLIAGTSEVIE